MKRSLGSVLSAGKPSRINVTRLTDVESMTVRVAIDTLANVLAEGLDEDQGLAQRYAAALVAIQKFLDSRKPRTQ